MAMQTGKSGLAARLNDKAKQAFEKNKAKVETPFDMGELPGGISGIAQLVRCGFSQITEVKPTDKHGGKVGDYWFNAMGVVVDPVWWVDDNSNKVRVAGKQTRIIEACFDTPRKSDKGRSTQEEHLDWIIRQLKFLLGGTLEDFSVNDLEVVCEMLTKQKPYFSFSVTEGEPSPIYPKPKKFHNWNGRVDDFVPLTNAGVMKDNTKSQPSTNGTHTANASAQNTTTTSSPSTFSQDDRSTIGRTQESQRNVAPVTPSQDFDEFGDIDSLVERAGNGDEAAGAELTELAVKAGVPSEDVQATDSWEDVAVLIKDQQSEGASVTNGDEDNNNEDAEPQKVITPKLGTVYRFKPKDKRKPVDVECVKVNTKQSKCNLKDMASEKVYADIPFSEVLPPS